MNYYGAALTMLAFASGGAPADPPRVPSVLLPAGAVAPQTPVSGKSLPDLHSPEWAPELEPTLRSRIMAEMVMLTGLLNAPASGN